MVEEDFMARAKEFYARRDSRPQIAESLLAEAFTLCTPGRPFLGEPVGALLWIVIDHELCDERTLFHASALELK